MRINNNVTAYVTNNALLNSENAFTISTRKLSSGFKINTAGDDPTGYAISGRIKMQLAALDRAKTNTTTGISMLETAEGTVAEIQDMVQRMNELAVKAANGTLSENDRSDIQKEVDQLAEEIDRIMETSELNERKLLDGTFENTGYCESSPYISVDSYNDRTKTGPYTMKITMDDPVQTDGGYTQKITVSGTFPKDPSTHTLNISYPQYYDPERPYDDSSITGVTLGLYQDPAGNGSLKIAEDGTHYITVRSDAGEEVTLKIMGEQMESTAYEMKASKELPDGRIRDYTVKMNIFKPSTEINDKDQNYTITGKGAMRLQIGANEDENIAVSLPKMSLERLDLDGIDVSTEAAATHAIERINNALAYTTEARARIGAFQNRAERAISYIDTSSENLTTSYSRIHDTDMSEEMTTYANYQVLTQAATSMLAQANQAPQQALQLLQ